MRAIGHLRYRCFRARAGAVLPGGLDLDRFDRTSLQIVVEDRVSGGIAGCFRLAIHRPGGAVRRGYSGQFYDLGGLARYPGAIGEVGRFCTAPGRYDPDIWRLALAGLGRLVEGHGIGLLMGCTSFHGADGEGLDRRFARLMRDHGAPEPWRPRIGAPEILRFAAGGDAAAAPRAKTPPVALPPLLRFYLGLGGWVSDHAVIDRDLDTLHVFTGVEIARIPAAWRRFLTGTPNVAAPNTPTPDTPTPDALGQPRGLHVDAAGPAV